MAYSDMSEPWVHNTKHGWWILAKVGNKVIPIEIKEGDRKLYRKLGTSHHDGNWGAPIYDLEGAAQLRASEYSQCMDRCRFFSTGKLHVLVTKNVGPKNPEDDRS